MNTRLTFHKDNGEFGIEGIDIKSLDTKLYMVVAKLKDYENLGFNPDEVELLKNMYDDLVRRYDKVDEKLTPMKVKLEITSKVKAVDVENGKVYTYPVVRCPACDKPMTLYKDRKHCEKCGQALDWGE